MKRAHIRRTPRDKCTLSAEGSGEPIFRRVMSLRNSSGPRNDFQSFFKVFFWKKICLDIFWRSFRGIKTYSEKKKINWSGLLKDLEKGSVRFIRKTSKMTLGITISNPSISLFNFIIAVLNFKTLENQIGL